MREGGDQDIPSIFLKPHSAEKIPRGESLSVSLISGTKKLWIRGVGEYQIFRRIFCLTVPNVFIS